MPDRIFYLFDPLCGWCYGASVMLDQLRADGTEIEALPTGLFSGSGARPLDRDFAEYAWSNDQRIERLTGQHFSQAYRHNVLEKPGAVFDSGAVTLGIIAAGMPDPQLRFDALTILQKARYVDGLDTAETGVVAELLQNAGFGEAAERVRQPDEALRTALRDTVSRGHTLFHRMNANGVPALVTESNGTLHLLAGPALYGSYDNLKAHLQAA